MNLNAVYAEGIIREFRERASNSFHKLGESDFGRGVQSIQRRAKEKIGRFPSEMVTALNRGNLSDDYSHIYRRKTRWELFLLSGAVCGIEFCYAAETAFVSPLLLRLGVKIEFLSMIWCLSPLVGLFLAPVLGSMSDSCRARLGRRRPFIIALSVGIMLGLLFVPNGKDIGIALGDWDVIREINATISTNSTVEDWTDNGVKTVVERHHPWGIVFTVLGTVMLDFCADACQSPSRTYLLDVTVPEDHVVGLSVFTIMAGLGGSIGYAMGGINWESTFLGTLLGSHERAVFSLVTILFVICLMATVTSFREIPLDLLCDDQNATELKTKDNKPSLKKYEKFDNEDETDLNSSYGTLSEPGPSLESQAKDLNEIPATANGLTQSTRESHSMVDLQSPQEINDSSLIKSHPRSLKAYLKSIVILPKSMKILCLTNLFCWMSLVSYSLYFTDFVGECVFGGDPNAAETEPAYLRYQHGVRFGCWGMSLYSLSCSGYSYIIEALVKRLGAKKVFIGGQLVYTVGMILMAVTRHKVSVILLSPTAGIMYATLFTMPYLIVAHYHATETFSRTSEEDPTKGQQVRGIGTDVAIVGSMVFLAQFLLSTCMGSIVSAVGSSVATVCASVFFSACGALCATQVLYLDL